MLPSSYRVDSVPTVKLASPPQLSGTPKYSRYKDWLLAHFYRNLCSFCFLQYSFLEVEHYEPVHYARDREHDPTNLLLACAGCNRGKSDYHPAHATRRRLPSDRSGHLVVDARREDFSKLFRLEADGAICARDGRERDRTNWNISLLHLDLRDDERKKVFDLLDAAEQAANNLEGDHSKLATEILEALIPTLSQYALFFRAYGISLSDPLSARLAAAR